jgi:hypothetical protein
MALLVGSPKSAVVDESGVSPVDTIPPLFSMLIYYLGNEK